MMEFLTDNLLCERLHSEITAGGFQGAIVALCKTSSDFQGQNQR